MIAPGAARKPDPRKVEQATGNPYLPMYQEAPEYDLSIDQIVELAHHRHLLHETLKTLEESNQDYVLSQLAKMGIMGHQLRHYASDARLPACASKVPEELDVHTFFSLLLVSLRDEASRVSFVAQEAAIFSARLHYASKLSTDSLPPEILELDGGTLDLMAHQTGPGEFRFPFEIVFPYISVATADVQNGMVVVTGAALRPMFVQFYEKFLQRKIERYLADRIHEREIFKAVVSLYTDKLEEGQDRTRENWEKVALRDLDMLASRSFPPCMYAMFTKLRESHKLFHEGRLQLGLFLKGIGLSLEDSLAFWRHELSQLAGDSGFDKQYAYNIRYNYGKEGSAKNRTAYSCMGILRHPAPAATQTHGCPFMQWGRPKVDGPEKKGASRPPLDCGDRRQGAEASASRVQGLVQRVPQGRADGVGTATARGLVRNQRGGAARW
jgi:hypothetical protein